MLVQVGFGVAKPNKLLVFTTGAGRGNKSIGYSFAIYHIILRQPELQYVVPELCSGNLNLDIALLYPNSGYPPSAITMPAVKTSSVKTTLCPSGARAKLDKGVKTTLCKNYLNFL